MSAATSTRGRVVFSRAPEFSSLLIMAVMLAITAILQRGFFQSASIVRNINAFTPLVLLTMGQAVVIMAGGIDLSTGAALSLVSCVLDDGHAQGDPWSGALALVLAFAVALAAGLINGVGIGYLRIPPVIVTFATSYMWLGAALFLRPTPGGEAVEWFKAFYNVASIDGVSPTAALMGAFSRWALLLVIIGAFLLHRDQDAHRLNHTHTVGGDRHEQKAASIPRAAYPRLSRQLGVRGFGRPLLRGAKPVRRRPSRRSARTLRAIAAAVVGGSPSPVAAGASHSRSSAR